MMTRRDKEAGFTLIEVLAALLVFSLAIMGLTRTGTQSAQAVAALEAKTWAGIAADNQLVLTRAAPVTEGRRTGQSDVMGRAYNFDIETAPTETPDFYRLTINVRARVQGAAADSGQVIVSRTGFMQRERATAPASAAVTP